jgi:hypothetical protein
MGEILSYIVVPVFFVAYLVLLLTSLSQIARESMLSSTARVLWIGLVVIVPIIGAVVWLTYGRPVQARTTH